MTSLSSEQLKASMRLAGQLRHEADRVPACGSAEINQRSRRELGGAGLAKAEGFVNPRSLIAALTGSTKADARKIDHLGKSLMDASAGSFSQVSDLAGAGVDDPGGDEPGDIGPHDVGPVRPPWFASITELMRSGHISPDRFEALRAGLGSTSGTVPGQTEIPGRRS